MLKVATTFEIAVVYAGTKIITHVDKVKITLKVLFFTQYRPGGGKSEPFFYAIPYLWAWEY